MKDQSCSIAAFRQPANLTPLAVQIDGDMFVCPCKSTSLNADANGGASGAYQYEWRTSTNGITYGGIVGTNSSYSVTVPCTEGEGIFVEVTVISSIGEEATDVYYAEAKDPPYPNMDCPVELVNNNGNDGAIVVSPNPATNMTKLSYQVTAAGQVTLSLFDYNGIQLKVIEDGWKEEGHYQTELNMSQYHSGTYFVTLRTVDQVASEKLTKFDR